MGSRARPLTVEPVVAVVQRVRWRVRVQTALRNALLAGALGLGIFAAIVLLVKGRAIDTDWTTLGGGIAIALPALAAIVGLARRLDDIRLAAALDATGGLHSRLGSALAFARLSQRTPMQEAAMHDALGVIERASPKLAAPWQWGAFTAGGIAAGVALLVTVPTVFAVSMPVGVTDGSGLGPLGLPLVPLVRQKVEIRADDQKKLEALAEVLDEESKQVTDETIRDFLADLNELIRAMQEGRITPEEAHARLAALEKALAEWKDQALKDVDKVSEQLKTAAEKKRDPHPDLKPFVDALKQDKLEEAAKALEKAAEKLKADKLGDKDKKKIQKDLEELAKAFQSERQKEKERLQKDRDRLKEKEKKEPDRLTQKEKDRLKELERDLEKLEREEKEISQAMRQLEKLARELGGAAEDLLRRLAEQFKGSGGSGSSGPEDMARRDRPGQGGRQGGQEGGQQGGQQAGQQGGQEGGQQGEQAGQQGAGGQGGMTAEDLERAAEALRRMGQGGQGRQQMRAAEGRMVDVREMLRRAGEGKSQAGRGRSGQPGQSGKSGQGGEPGQSGQSGQGEGETAFERFEDGARGKDGKGPKGDEIMLGEAGKPGEMMLLGGDGKGKPDGSMTMPGRGKQAGADARVGGDGVGQGHDKRLLGDKTSMDVETYDDFVAGQQGDGESKSTIIYAAAQKGFASRGYAEVHQDYSEVVEDALDREHIPAGRRTYVRKYFDLIRPR